MKLLVLTQKVDQEDDVLGFFHEWLKRFAARCETIEVICLYEGVHELPVNVRVHSLGKEKGAGRLARLFKFYKYLWRFRGRYEAVFVHMNPEYLVLAGWWWRLAGTRTLLWYSHRNVDLKLRIAEFFVNAIASSAATSFTLKTSKLHVLGHGIDTNFFAPGGVANRPRWGLVSVGRITSIKRLKTAIEALGLIREQGIDAELVLVGQAGSAADRIYQRELLQKIGVLSLEPYVQFVGPVPYSRMPEVYKKTDVSVNLAPTGGLDKAVLESMATGLPTLVSNKGFADFLGPYRDRLLFAQDDATDLAEKLIALYHAIDRPAIAAFLRSQVGARASLDSLIGKLISLL